MRKKVRPSDGQVVSSTHQAKQKWLQVKSRLYLNVLLLQGSNYCCYCPTHHSPLLPRTLLLPRTQLPRTLLPHALLPRTLLPHALLPRALLPRTPPPPPPLRAPAPLLLPRAAAVGHPSCQSVVDHPSSSVIDRRPSVVDCHRSVVVVHRLSVEKGGRRCLPLMWLGAGGFICGFEIVKDNYSTRKMSKREANVEAALPATDPRGRRR